MNVLREEREKQGLTRDELAYQAGVSVSTIVRAEESPKKIHRNSLRHICSVLSLDIKQVLASAK